MTSESLDAAFFLLIRPPATLLVKSLRLRVVSGEVERGEIRRLRFIIVVVARTESLLVSESSCATLVLRDFWWGIFLGDD